VANFDVTSNLVLTADQSVTVGTGFIKITDFGGSNGGSGYQSDTSTNTQMIDVATAIRDGYLSITGSGTNTKIFINPKWDLDLSSKYQVSFEAGVFMDAAGTHFAMPIAPITFNTVTPGIHVDGDAIVRDAATSQQMDANTGMLVAGKSWLDVQDVSYTSTTVKQLGDLSTGAYALVMKNYATRPGGSPLVGGNASDGISTHDTNVGAINFGNNDVVYFDSQVNNSSIQFFDIRYVNVVDGESHGGLTGQNGLSIGVVSAPVQKASTANILLGLEGNVDNTIYAGIVTLPTGTVGWADVLHNTNPPVIMG
jgi:hypothetical protein